MNWRREAVKMAVPPGNHSGEVTPVCVDGVFFNSSCGIRGKD